MNSIDKAANNIALCEELGQHLVSGKYKVTKDKYSDETGRIIKIEVSGAIKESLINVSSRIFEKLGKDKDKISTNHQGTKYLTFGFTYTHPFKSCEYFPTEQRKQFLNDWSVFRIVDSIKGRISDQNLLAELTEKFKDPRHIKEITSEKRKAKLAKNIDNTVKWMKKFLPKKRDYSDY